MKILNEKLALYFIMGSNNCTLEPVHVLTEAINGGITFFQFREKGVGSLKGIAKRELAQELQTICRSHGIPFIVNDDIDLAMELNADGVHIGQEDGTVRETRKRIGKMILGLSAHNVAEARQAVEDGADYLGVGPMYHTVTKKDIRVVQGPGVVKKVRETGITIPIVGIGGITSSNAKEVIAAGADGIAVISAISQANSPRRSACRLFSSISQ